MKAHGAGMSEEGITEAVSGLRELAQRFRVRLILQFGSTVTGTTHDRSDLDLAILHRADPLFLKKIVESCRVLFGILPRPRLSAPPRFQSVPRLSALLGIGTPVCRTAIVSADGEAVTPMIDCRLITRKMSLILEDVDAMKRFIEKLPEKT
jgi:predicted nucleotidyltransferase